MELKRDRLLQGGRYRIIESIGRGGFGITYLAEQVMAKRKVCIKEFFPKDYYKRDGDTGALTISSDGFAESMNKFKAKFVKEAQTIAALDHHNIIPIYDIFEENNTAYYVMEYIDGVSLSSIVKESGALSEDVAVGYIKQVASALAHIHEQQIMHLDVKPGNIMVRSKDDHAILIDFGLSKHYDENSGEATSTTPVGVSHGYAPIEQYKQGGVNRFSPETDIYSLGATLYYIATGIVPPHAADMGKDGIGELPSELSSGVCAAIRKSMNYWKEDRPHTIKEFLELLDSKTATPIVPVVANEKTTLDSDNNIASEQKSTPKPAEQKQKTEQKQTPKATPTEKKATEPKAAPAEKKAAEPKKGWTPKYGVNKPKTSENETSKKRKSLWWLWLIILLLIGGVAYLMFMGGDKAAPISNTTKTAKPQLDTFEQIDSDSTTLNQLRQDSINMAIRDNAIRDSIAGVERERFVRDSTAAAEQKKREEEARIAEKKKREEEARIAEKKKQEEEARIAEKKKREEEARIAEKKREEEARKAEQQRIDNMIAQGLGRDGVYQVGDYYNRNFKEGVVFWVTDGGRHGKIVSLDETELKWCTDKQYKRKIALGLTNKSDGKANTDKVMKRDDSNQYPAFVWCREKGADWYLPAKEELKAIFNSKSKINSTLAKYDAKLRYWYWSSTEHEDCPEFCAWKVAMYSDDTLGTDKYGTGSVRAVSAF